MCLQLQSLLLNQTTRHSKKNVQTVVCCYRLLVAVVLNRFCLQGGRGWGRFIVLPNWVNLYFYLQQNSLINLNCWDVSVLFFPSVCQSDIIDSSVKFSIHVIVFTTHNINKHAHNTYEPQTKGNFFQHIKSCICNIGQIQKLKNLKVYLELNRIVIGNELLVIRN